MRSRDRAGPFIEENLLSIFCKVLFSFSQPLIEKSTKKNYLAKLSSLRLTIRDARAFNPLLKTMNFALLYNKAKI